MGGIGIALILIVWVLAVIVVIGIASIAIGIWRVILIKFIIESEKCIELGIEELGIDEQSNEKKKEWR